MNYIIEGNIDFYNEISVTNDSNEEDEPTSQRCLITYELLEKNSIKLPCAHTFNYLPLYKEICNQKKIVPSYLNNFDNLLVNQMKCPYCRLKIDTILPYIQIYDSSGNKLVNRVNGVNSPERYCLKLLQCEWSHTNKENEIVQCEKNAYYELEKCTDHAYCAKHWQRIKQKINSEDNKAYANKKKATEKAEADAEWSDEMEKYSKSKSLIDIKKILREKGLTVTGNKKQLVQRLFKLNNSIGF